jgi:hypothetical protein
MTDIAAQERESQLRKMERVGVSVYCTSCGRRKAPRGRSAPAVLSLCNFECSGYDKEPKVGDLWPGERESEFGYPCGSEGTKLYPVADEPA